MHVSPHAFPVEHTLQQPGPVPFLPQAAVSDGPLAAARVRRIDPTTRNFFQIMTPLQVTAFIVLSSWTKQAWGRISCWTSRGWLGRFCCTEGCFCGSEDDSGAAGCVQLLRAAKGGAGTIAEARTATIYRQTIAAVRACARDARFFMSAAPTQLMGMR